MIFSTKVLGFSLFEVWQDHSNVLFSCRQIQKNSLDSCPVGCSGVFCITKKR